MAKYLWAAAAGVVMAGCAGANSSGISKGAGIDRKVTVQNASAESIRMHAFADCTEKINSEFDAVLKPGESYPMFFSLVPEKSLPWAEFQVGTGKKTWFKFEGGEQAGKFTDGLYVAGTEAAVYELTVSGGEVVAARR